MKGRAVLLGDNVTYQNFNWAELCELGSSPPSMEAAKALDAMGSFPGCVAKPGDARGPHAQSVLKGVVTWVTLPDIRWPTPRGKKLRKPAVRLIIALYVHAEAGGVREEHCE